MKRFFKKNLVLQLLYPIFLIYILIALIIRGFKNKAYRERVAERFGKYSFNLKNSLWVHAVSGGEVITIRPVIEKLLKDYPHFPLIVTTMTPTGLIQLEKLMGKKVHHAYLPYDFPFAVNSFLKTMQPKLAIFVETEIWPTLTYLCNKHQVPLLLLNARLSEKSYKRYQMVKYFMMRAFQSFDHLAVQTKEESDRFHALGVAYEKMTVTGSLKFDVERPASLFTEANSLRTVIGNDRFTWIAASTHKNEEEIILAAQQIILKTIPNALLILVPKHPERFAAVAELAAKYGKIAKRSQNELPLNDTAIYLGDTLGELVMLYAAADVAFVGGSFIPQGGHNLLEPASVKTPVISGRHLFNFTAISQWLLAANALILVDDAASLANAVLHLYAHPNERNAQSERALQVCNEHKGSLQKQYEIVKQFI